MGAWARGAGPDGTGRDFTLKKGKDRAVHQGGAPVGPPIFNLSPEKAGSTGTVRTTRGEGCQTRAAHQAARRGGGHRAGGVWGAARGRLALAALAKMTLLLCFSCFFHVFKGFSIVFLGPT